ncbi:sugar transferase [Flagellimonas lutimaris]|uniref:sugar transferase n=1 Tax=Flagellimonas lutimaris TaxID=475082 RepID=UPI0015FF7CE0|nr:sugar transferase [Allomuricauda lutimaris]
MNTQNPSQKGESNCAPICLFVYNRLEETKITLEELRNNYLAPMSDLFIFSDGPKSEFDNDSVNDVREFISNIGGFRSVKIIEQKENLGLAKSIINGVTRIVNEYGAVIVIEDDIKTSKNFLNFLNQGLDFYRRNDRIQSISGYTMPLKGLNKLEKDFYYGLRASSWGWATWKHVWNKIDWDVNDYDEFKKNESQRRSFNELGSDMAYMLKNKMTGRIDSWAIVFCYDQWKNQRFTVYPKESKVENIGFSEKASNTQFVVKEYIAKIDKSNKETFVFDKNIELNKTLLKQFSKNYSIPVRLKNKILRLIG